MTRSVVNYAFDGDLAFAQPGTTKTSVGANAITPNTDGVASGDTASIYQNGTGLLLDKLTRARADSELRDTLGAETYDVVIAVSALDTADADETYTFAVEVGAAGAAAQQVGEIAVETTGQYVIKLDAQTIENLDADHVEIELSLTTAGTTPSITFAAWLVLGR